MSLRAIPRSARDAPQCVTLAEAVRASHASIFGVPLVAELRLRVSRERLSRPNLPAVLNLGETAWALCLNRWAVRGILVRRQLRGRQAISGEYIVWRVELEDVRRFAAEREARYTRKSPLWDL